MTSGKVKILKIAAAVIAAGIISASGYTYVKLSQERNLLEADLVKSEKRGDLLQRKYVEEKARAGAVMRTKQSLENTVRAMQTQIDAAKTEKPIHEQVLKDLEAKCTEKTKLLDEKIEKLMARTESLKTSRDEVVAKFKERAAVVKENEKKIAQLNEDLQRSGFELKSTGRQLENCRENNSRLCMMTEELVEKYKNKGVVGSIMITEPFTQLEKVEIEKLVQEYTAKIEKEKIE